jgi:glyceraldehyde 3-phosphate dehydrogenase
MIPTSTGAAKAVGLVLPQLKGKLHGMAIRVPTPNVSLVDLAVETEKVTTPDEVNEALRKAAATTLQGILEVSEEPLVSVDLNHTAVSATVEGHAAMGRSRRLSASSGRRWDIPTP